MLPRLQLNIPRSSIRTYSQLEQVAVAAEKAFRVAKSFRPPPRPEKSLLPDLAYHEQSNRPSRKKEQLNICYGFTTEESESNSKDDLYYANDDKKKSKVKSTDSNTLKDNSKYPKDTKVNGSRTNSQSTEIKPNSSGTKTSNSRSEESSAKDSIPYNGSQVKCFNCYQTGNRHRDCKESRKIYCFSCGKKDVIKSECPNCAENSKQDR